MSPAFAASAVIAVLALLSSTASPSAEAASEVRSAFTKFAALSSYSIVTQDNGPPAEIDYVRPNAIQLSAPGLAVIQIGQTRYVRGERAWQIARAGQGPSPAEVLRSFLKLLDARNLLSATDLGMATRDGESLHPYEIITRGGTHAVVSIGRDGFPYRMEIGSSVTWFGKFNSVSPIRAPI